MDEQHRQLLRKHRMDLSRDLDHGRATSFLYAESILTENDKEEIEAAKASTDKSEKLLDILPKRGPDAFGIFMEFLKKNQPHLFDMLYAVPEERPGPVDNTDTSVLPQKTVGAPSIVPGDKPVAETDPYNFKSNPRSVSSTFANPVTSQTNTDLHGGTVSTDTQVGGISSNSLSNEHGYDQGDGNRSSQLKFTRSTHSDGVDTTHIYPMYNSPKGQAFIINNKNFEPSSGMQKYPRNGTDVDAEALEKLFRGLGFETKVFNNVGTKRTFEIVSDYSSMDYSRYDCFMCAILTHGEEGVIYSVDGKIPIKEITSKFRSRQLVGKPKLFFIQACQGFEYMEGADQHDGPAPPDVDEVDAPGSNKITLPVEADFLYAYSTVPGYYSWRNSVRGSWFAQAIVSVFQKHKGTMDVLRMLTRVNAEVSKQKSNTNDYFSDNKKQIPSIISQLRKELYFFPENVVGQMDWE